MIDTFNAHFALPPEIGDDQKKLAEYGYVCIAQWRELLEKAGGSEIPGKHPEAGVVRMNLSEDIEGLTGTAEFVAVSGDAEFPDVIPG